MVYIIGILLGIAVIYVFLNKMALRRLPCIELANGESSLSEDMAILDLRDFNESYKSKYKEAYFMPSAYLKRYYSELPKKNWIIVASDRRFVKADLLFLKRKGHKIVGFLNDHTFPNQSYQPCKSLVKI